MKRIISGITHFFVPKRENNYQPQSLRTDFLTYYLLIALFLAFFFKSNFFGSNNILGFATDISVEKLYQLTNAQRIQYNLPLLRYNDKLAQAAAKKANDMFAKNYWAHYAPDGATPWEFILNSGYRYEYAGENLAKNFLFSNNVVEAWMESQSHKENILRKEYADIGFAIVNGRLNGEETTLVVQLFGKPQSSALANLIPITNVDTQPKILAKQIAKPVINRSSFTFNLNVVFVSFLMMALLLDFYFAIKMNLFRLRGKHLAHLIFLGFILMGIFFITKGSII